MYHVPCARVIRIHPPRDLYMGHMHVSSMPWLRSESYVKTRRFGKAYLTEEALLLWYKPLSTARLNLSGKRLSVW
jgi:hypothetical protein